MRIPAQIQGNVTLHLISELGRMRAIVKQMMIDHNIDLSGAPYSSFCADKLHSFARVMSGLVISYKLPENQNLFTKIGSPVLLYQSYGNSWNLGRLLSVDMDVCVEFPNTEVMYVPFNDVVLLENVKTN